MVADSEAEINCVRARAEQYHGSGISILPVALDGSKRPAYGWQEYQSRRSTEAERARWFDGPNPYGIGAIGGTVSGNLEILDFDHDAKKTFAAFMAAVEEQARGLSLLLVVAQTPSGGYHVWYRCPDGKIDGNKKLARTEAGRTLIETRGEGGFVVAPGSPVACHKTGKPYQCEQGDPAIDLPHLTIAEREMLLSIARSFDRKGDKQPASASPPAAKPMSMTATGSDPMSPARTYLAKCDIAVEKCDGSGTLMATLRKLFANFGDKLSPDELRQLALEYSDRCQPPWSEKQIDHAIESINARPSEPLEQRQQPSDASNTPADAMDDGEQEQESTRNASDSTKHSAADVVQLTDLGNCKRMAAEHGKIIRYCFAWGKWLVWDGRRWKIDDTGYVMLLAKRTIMGLYAWAEKQLKLLANDDSRESKVKAIKVKAVLDFAIKSQNVNRFKAMVDLARSEPNIPIRHTDLDRDQFALNCLNGKVDLRTGRLYEHNPNDYITALCPTRYDPSAKCPIFLKTIEGIFKKDAGVIRYVSRFLGYCLSGETCEQIVPFAIGGGSNGKSLLFNLIIAMMGSDYAGTVVPELLMETAGNQHPTIKADLFGKRYMVAMESADGAKLNEARLKALSGGDRIKARRCNEDFWEFDATHKILLCTNHKPMVVGSDHGIWRRLALIPFTATFWDADKGETGPADMKADKSLVHKLQAEHEGILAWLVRGCLAWQSEGLIAPAAILNATSEYKTDEDRVKAFLDEVCILYPGSTDYRTKVSDLTSAYKRWCDKANEKGMSSNSLTRALADKGVVKDDGRRNYLGVTISALDAPTANQSDAATES